MGSLQCHARYSLEEYLSLEAYSNVKHEYRDGAILAMAGGTIDHGRICANVIVALGTQLAGRPCAVFTSDVRVRIQANGDITYPDVSVVCGQAVRDPGDPLSVVNPVVLVEVASPSTAEYDRGEKREIYQLIPSLREIVFVSHAERRLDLWRRETDGWREVPSVTTGQVELASIGCALEVDVVYRDPLAG